MENSGLKKLLQKTETRLQKALDDAALCRGTIKAIKKELNPKPKKNAAKSANNKPSGNGRSSSTRKVEAR